MKIDNSIKSLGGLSSDARKDVAKPANTSASPRAGQNGGVALSPLSARLQEMESAMATTPMVDSQRVSDIREAIASGAFQIDASKIADGLIDSVRQMLASQK